jgi:hypothetical protein
MQFTPSQNPWSASKLPAANSAFGQRGAVLNLLRKPDLGPCGWYDSSFDLRGGLDVDEQDDDTLFQLWELAAK